MLRVYDVNTGYLTPPGGPDPYWADCEYPIFVAYTYLNGFALVTAVAAIFAVTFGPVVLVAQGRPGWRKKVVVIGLFHLVLSLLSFMGAFACAGFVTALVRPPPATCALIKCSEGGIPCSSRPQELYPKGASVHNAWYLDPVLLKLNRESFSNHNVSKSDELPDVICARYAGLDDCSDDTPCICVFPDCVSDGADPICSRVPYYNDHFTWCSTLSSGEEGATDSSPLIGSALQLNAVQLYNIMKMLSFGSWSPRARNTTDIGAVYSEFNQIFKGFWDRAHQENESDVLMEDNFCFPQSDLRRVPTFDSAINNDFLTEDPPWAVDKSGVWAYKWQELYSNPFIGYYMQILGGHGIYSSYGFERNAALVIPDCWELSGGAGLGCGDDPYVDSGYIGFRGKPESSFNGKGFSMNGAWYKELISSSKWIGPDNINVHGNSTDAESDFYWQTPQGAELYLPQDYYQPGGYHDPLETLTLSSLAFRTSWRSHDLRQYLRQAIRGPLENATNYATLRYVCAYSVLCDKGEVSHPLESPLAVDPDGQHLTRADVIRWNGRDEGVNPTTLQLEIGVVAMLIFAAFVNFLTVLWLAHEERIQSCGFVVMQREALARGGWCC